MHKIYQPTINIYEFNINSTFSVNFFVLFNVFIFFWLLLAVLSLQLNQK